MPDSEISELTDGGLIQGADEIPAVRSGSNVKVHLGDIAAAVVIDNSAALVLSSAHDGKEIYLRPGSGSPSGYIVTIPYSLAIGFSCRFMNLANATEIQIKAASGSPNCSLNGVSSGTATFTAKYKDAFLRKTAAGELIIVGSHLTVA